MITMRTVDNSQDVMDSRDILARIEELDEMELDEIDEDEREELTALKEFASELEGYCEDWRYGVTLVRDDYFETYAREMAEEIGAIDPNANWPLNRIDWEAAADDLRQDYTSGDLDGVTYWAR